MMFVLLPGNMCLCWHARYGYLHHWSTVFPVQNCFVWIIISIIQHDYKKEFHERLSWLCHNSVSALPASWGNCFWLTDTGNYLMNFFTNFSTYYKTLKFHSSVNFMNKYNLSVYYSTNKKKNRETTIPMPLCLVWKWHLKMLSLRNWKISTQKFIFYRLTWEI